MNNPQEIFTRNIMFYGDEVFASLQQSCVAVVGLGGVGGYAAEILVRAGLGAIRIVDCDIVKPSDSNRQLIATSDAMGRPKVEVLKERLCSISPSLAVDPRHAFFHADTATTLITKDVDFVVDAIDSLSPKGELIRSCLELSVPIISVMGAAGRADPAQVRIASLDGTVNCHLARALRRHLRSRGIPTDIPVVCSTEQAIEAREAGGAGAETTGTYIRGRRRMPLPSLPTIPAIFGILAADYVIKALAEGSAASSRPR
jgi:tRNA threonylcarbamoyladenosine dehydratase